MLNVNADVARIAYEIVNRVVLLLVQIKQDATMLWNLLGIKKKSVG
jgi:hypothetical protein